MSRLSLSIVTPAFNRKNIISRSINSSLSLVKDGYAKELIIIDDGSTDGTYDELLLQYSEEISKEIIKLHRFNINFGVTGAKNKGAELASEEWIAFMDSDDVFLPNSGFLINEELTKFANFNIVFFRCSDLNSGEIIGGKNDDFQLTMRKLFNEGGELGELLPIIKRSSILQYPYNTSLRGCESLSYYKMLSNNCTAFISSKVVRGYDFSATNRLSSVQGVKKRAAKLVKYNFISLKYIQYSNIRKVIGIFSRIIYYTFLTFKKNS